MGSVVGASDGLIMGEVADRAGIGVRFAQDLVNARVIAARPSGTFDDMSGSTALTEERGDRAAFRFRDPARGVLGALEIVAATVPTGLPPVHVGMHAGAVVVRDGDVFGRTVNLAARISGVAGQVLVTREITEIMGIDAGIRFEPDGPAQLKGVAAPVDLFRAER